MDPQALIAVARILGAHGMRGEIKIVSLSDFPNRLKGLKAVHLLRSLPALAGSAAPVQIESIRGDIVKLDILKDRDAAKAVRNAYLAIRKDELKALPDGRYYDHDIVGLTARDLRRGILGTVTGVLHTGSNAVYEVQGDGGETLVPALKSVVKRIDLSEGILEVELPEGLVP